MNLLPYYRELGIYSDLVAAARQQRISLPFPRQQNCSSDAVRSLLHFSFASEYPLDVQMVSHWRKGGLVCEELAWSVGYGPPTSAWLLMPENVSKPLPGVLALHDHGAFKYFGREKIADGPEQPPPAAIKYRENLYEGTAFANDLARMGFAVLVHDAFLWGSRKFPLESMPPSILSMARASVETGQENMVNEAEIDFYNACASLHELVLEKYFSVLGTSLAGIVSYEDRLALNYLAGRPEVDNSRLGCIGLSGGGCRAALLAATSGRISAAVISGMMSTYGGLLDRHVSAHTWMIFPSPLARCCDWPDLVGNAYQGSLLVQYNLDDALFSLQGMQEADRLISQNYQKQGRQSLYDGIFYPGPHKFDRRMQADAFSWLGIQLQLQNHS